MNPVRSRPSLDFRFIRPDVTPSPLRSSHAPLIGGQCTAARVVVDRRTAGQQSQCLRRAAVIGQRGGQQGIGVAYVAGGSQAAGVAAVQIIPQRGDIRHRVAAAVVGTAISQTIDDDGA